MGVRIPLRAPNLSMRYKENKMNQIKNDKDFQTAWRLYHSRCNQEFCKENYPNQYERIADYYKKKEPTRKEYWTTFCKVYFIGLLCIAILFPIISLFVMQKPWHEMRVIIYANILFFAIMFGPLMAHSAASAYRDRDNDK